MKKRNRIISATLGLCMTASMFSAFSVNAYAETVYFEESEAIAEDIKESGEFYVSTPNVNMKEGSGDKYAAVIKRGGDSLEAASVRLTIIDVSSQYGKDYKIEVPDSGFFGGVENTRGASSIYALAQENGGMLDEVNGYDEIAAMGKTDEEIQEMYAEDMQSMSEDLAEELQNYVEEKSQETGRSAEEIIAEAKENSPLSAAFEAASGLTDDSAPMDGGTTDASGIMNAYSDEKLTYLAKQLNSPYIVLDFEEGETEKTIKILPKDNNDGEGNKMFLVNLYPESDNAVISELKGITAVIEDDEEWSEPIIEFAESVYYPEGGFADITIKRDGILTDISAVKLTTLDGTAMEGRDYSKVDTLVVFPYGIRERTIKVPVRSDYIDTAVNFNLSLSDAQNCTLGESSTAQGIVEANSVSYKDSEAEELEIMEDAGVSDVIVSDKEALEYKSPYWTSTKSDGYARVEGDNYELYASSDVYDRVWTRACWNTKDKYTHYDYDGYQIDWTKESGKSCWTDNDVKIYYGDEWHTVWENTEERWERRKTNIFPKQNEFKEIEISVSQRGAYLSKAAKLKIHAIKPILRPFEVSLKGAEPLKFRNENGDYVDNTSIAELQDATSAVLQGANNTGTGTAVKFSGEKITVTTTSRYAYIKELKLMHPSNGRSKVIKSGLPTGTTSASIEINNDFIKENLDYINFAANGGSRIKGQFMVQPVFDYYSSTVMVHNDKRATIDFNKDIKNKARVIGTYKIWNEAGGRYLSMIDKLSPGTFDISKSYNDWRCRWYLIDLGDGYYKIKNLEYGKLLTVSDVAAYIIMDDDKDTEWQKFKLQDGPGGKKYILTKASNDAQALSLKTKLSRASKSVEAYPSLESFDTNKALQLWTFEELERAPEEEPKEEEKEPITTFSVHKGDTIRFTQTINDEYKSSYTSSRIRFVKTATLGGKTFDDKSKYNDGDNSYKMLCDYSSIDAYVNLDKKDNQVIVRVAEEDVDKFDTSKGIFKNEYTAYGKFRDYTVVPKDSFSLNEYIEISAAAKNDGNVPVWNPSNDKKSYSQPTFYFETKEEGEDNIITLTCEKADSRKYSIVGTAHYSEVSLASQTEGASWRPASGVYIYLDKDRYAISDDSGNFSTIPACGINGNSIIYKVESSGRVNYGTATLSDTVTKQIDNGNGGTDIVNTVSIGDIKTSVTDSSAPYASAFTASNRDGVISGNIALISDDVSYLTTTIMNNNSAYTDSDGRKRTEKVKKVEFVIYDPITNREKSVIDGEAREILNQNGMSVWQQGKTFKKDESHLYTASDKIYVRVTTDRIKGNGMAYNEEGKPIKVDALNETTYPDVYTGYTLATTNMEKPVTHDIDIFSGDLDQFLTLPVIGSMNSTFMIKSVTLSISELPDGGFRLCLGWAKGKESAEADDDTDHQVPFTPERIKNEIKKAGEWGSLVGPKNAVGFSGGGIYPMFGIYLDFGLKEINHLDKDPVTGQGSSEKVLMFLGGGATIGAIGDYRLVIYGAIGPVPIYFGVDGSLAAFANIGIKIKSKDALGEDAKEYENVTFQEIKSGDKKIEDSVLFDFALQAHATLCVYVGAGIAGTFGIRGGAQIGASFIYYPTITKIYDINPVGFQATIGLKIWVDLVLLSIPSPELNLLNKRFGYYEDIDNLKKNNDSLFSTSSDNNIQTDEYGAFLRKGSGREEKWLPNGETLDIMSTFEMSKTTVLSEDGYENAMPQLMDIGGGRILLVYLSSDLSKGDYDRTSIVYSLYDNGRWLAPVEIAPDSAKGDFEPNLCDIGDKVLVSWISRNDDDNRTDSKEYLKGMNVYAAEIDKSTLEISTVEQLTDDDYYNSHPVGLYDKNTGDYVVYYLKAEIKDSDVGDTYKDSVNDSTGANLLTMASPTTNGAKLMYMLHDNERGWMRTDEKLSDNESLANGWGGQRFVVSPIKELEGEQNSASPRIIDFDAVSYDGKGVYAYTIDLDNNIDTMEDREVYVQLYDFADHKTYKPVRITNDNLTDTEPQLVRNDENTYLFWREGENTIRYISITKLLKYGMEDNETLRDQTADSDGHTRVYEMEQASVFSAMEDPEMKPSFVNYKVFVDKNDNMFIAWTQGEEEVDEDGKVIKADQEVYASAYIRETESVDGVDTALDSSWSEGMKLTESGRYNDGIAVWTDENGNLITVNNQFDIDYANTEATNIKLISTEYKTVGSAEVSDVRYADTTPLAGSTDTVTIDVKNKGLKAMTGFTLKAYENRNGTVSDTPVFEKTYNERVTPSSIVPVSFDWQMPESFEGITDLSLHITVQETGYDRINEFDAESIEFKPEYALHNVRTIGMLGGVAIAYELENIGNVDVDTDDDAYWNYDESNYTGDRVVMEYVDVYDTGAEEKTILDVPVVPVKAGEESSDFWLLDIPYEGYFKYGRLNASLEIRNNEDETLLQHENIHIALEYPRDIAINDAPLDYRDGVPVIALKEGESHELNAVYSDADYFKDGTVEFICDDPSVASVTDGKLYAVGEGETFITASVNPYGGANYIGVIVEAAETTPAPTHHSRGGGRSVSNRVNVNNSGSGANGKVSVSKTDPAKGETVTVTVTPNEGYELDKLTVTDKDGNELEITKNEDGTYSFVQPSGNVNVKPEFKKLGESSDGKDDKDGKDSEWWFKDVPESAWYYAPIKDAFDNGRMSGVSDGYFEPETAITRGMFAYAIYRREGLPETDTQNKFDDVRADTYYENAIAWATENEIVFGYDDTHYGPDDQITREQMAAILWRYAKFKEYDVSAGEDANISDFTDAFDISKYAVPAIQWAVDNNIITGFEDATMRPKANANRAQMAVILNKIAGMF